MVRAAGGIVLRRGPGGRPEVLLVHRPRYDDWSFPKGKAEPGESDEECALREVEEETGLRCELGSEVAVTRYRDGRGRRKRVRYFLMRADGEPRGRNEVDRVCWAALAEADELLTWERDRTVLGAIPGHG